MHTIKIQNAPEIRTRTVSVCNSHDLLMSLCAAPPTTFASLP